MVPYKELLPEINKHLEPQIRVFGKILIHLTPFVSFLSIFPQFPPSVSLPILFAIVYEYAIIFVFSIPLVISFFFQNQNLLKT